MSELHSPVDAQSVPFVGRNALLARLAATLDNAAKRQGRAIFLAGESGIGKTRICAELCEVAARRGFRIATGGGNPVEHQSPFALISDVMGDTLRSIDRNALTTMTRGQTAALAGIFPTVEALTPTGPREAGAPEEMKARAFWAFTQLLFKLAEKQPLLIVAENLQWSDSASLELIHFLARQIHSAPILLLATWTTDESNSANPASQSLATLERSFMSLGTGELARVEPLSLDATAELVSRTFDVALPPIREFAAFLYGWTRGNPLFITEALRSLADNGALRRDESGWRGWDVRSVTLPPTVRALLHVRIRAASDPARQVMNIAAVVGVTVTHALLGRTTGWSDAVLLELKRYPSTCCTLTPIRRNTRFSTCS